MNLVNYSIIILAKLLSLQDLQKLEATSVEKIPFSKEDKIYVICRSGNRSVTATKKRNGFYRSFFLRSHLKYLVEDIPVINANYFPKAFAKLLRAFSTLSAFIPVHPVL
jgi:hypothetical protein